MTVKLDRIAFKVMDSSAQLFDINTIEELVACINHEHNIDQIYGTLYFDNNQKLCFDDKQALFGAMFALDATNVVKLDLLPVAS